MGRWRVRMGQPRASEAFWDLPGPIEATRKGSMPLRMPMPERRRPVIATEQEPLAAMAKSLARKRFVALVLLFVVLAENRPQLGIRVLPVNYSL